MPPLRIPAQLPPDALVSIGPHVAATWTVPPVVADWLRRAGRAVPPPVNGYVLVDTGASVTCIDQDVAELQLKLRPTRVQEMVGSVGSHGTNAYFATFEFPVRVEGRSFVLRRDLESLGVRDLAQMAGELSRHVFPDGPMRSVRPSTPIIGLIGRDFLRHCRFEYDGRTGEFWLEVDGEWLARP
jgi:hypothetical protein